MSEPQFWNLVHQRAMQETLDALGIVRERVVIAVLVGGIYLLVVWTEIGTAAGGSETLLRIALSVAPMLAFPLVYSWKFVRAPAKLYGELDAEKGTLQRKLGALKEPKLQLSFAPDQSGFLEETTCGGIPCIYIRMLVKSKVTTSECEGSLTAMYRRENGKWVTTKYAESLLLTWGTRGHVQLDLHPDQRQFLDICFINEQDKLIIPCVHSFPVRTSDNVTSHGTYKLDILVTSKGGSTGASALIIELTDDWRKPRIITTDKVGSDE